MTNKTVFISIGLSESPGFPAIDKVAASACVRALWTEAEQNGHTLVIRAHPAVESFMEALSKYSRSPAPVFTSVPETSTACEIAGQFNLAAAIFIGGADDVMKDFEDLSARPNLILLSLPGTGGAAERLEQKQRESGAIPAILQNLPHEDPFGFDRIRAVMKPASGKAPLEPVPL